MPFVISQKKVLEKSAVIPATRAMIEIQSGSREKKVYDEELKTLRLERLLPKPLPTDVHYGFIPGTVSSDGDALDIFVLSSRNLQLCTIVDAKPIGIMRTHDERGPDDKIIAIDPLDEKYSALGYRTHASKEIRVLIGDFVSRAKDGERNKWVNVVGFEDAEAASLKIFESLQRS